MSKPKDKKNDNFALLQAQYQAQKRQLLESTFTLKKLQQKMTTLQSIHQRRTTENIMLAEDLKNQRRQYDDKIQELNIKEEANQQDLAKIRQQKSRLEVTNIELDSKVRYYQKQLQIQMLTRTKQLQENRKMKEYQISKYECQLTQYNQFMKIKKNLEEQIGELHNKIELSKIQRDKQVADKQRQKVQATDKLRDQMSKKTRQMKTNLLALKKEQLSTTTRLTILQNHQLTSQLQYQSKQTQKLIFKNEQMESKLNVLQRDLQIHKEVEQQLAKRSHISKGVIKKLNSRVTELQNQLQNLKKQSLKKSNVQINNISPQNINQIVNSLNHSLQSTQKKFCQLKTKYDTLLKEKQNLSLRLRKYQLNQNKITSILECQLQSLPIIVQKDHNINFQSLKQKEVEKWTPEEKKLIINILLKCIQNGIPLNSISKGLSLGILKNSINKIDNEVLDNSLPKLKSERQKKMQQSRIKSIPINIASKIVGSNLRQWGKTVQFSKGKMCLKRKYKLSQSYRG